MQLRAEQELTVANLGKRCLSQIQGKYLRASGMRTTRVQFHKYRQNFEVTNQPYIHSDTRTILVYYKLNLCGANYEVSIFDSLTLRIRVFLFLELVVNIFGFVEELK